MSNEIKIFSNEMFGNIRTMTINDEPWFVGKDVAEALGYSDTSSAIRDHVDSEDRAIRRPLKTNSGTQEAVFINESGLYSLILSSKLPSAKQFKKWVTSEVLPTIRKTGSYSLAPKTYKEALLALIAQEEEKERLALECEDLKVKLDESETWQTAGKAFPNSTNLTTIGKDLTKLSKSMNYEIRKNTVISSRFPVNEYHIDVIEQYRLGRR